MASIHEPAYSSSAGLHCNFPPGSHHEAVQGDDTVCGTIRLGEHGPTLDYDIGGLAGNYATGEHMQPGIRNFVWQKHDENNGEPFDYSLERNSQREFLAVTFRGYINFYGDLHEPDDLDRVLKVMRTLNWTTPAQDCRATGP